MLRGIFMPAGVTPDQRPVLRRPAYQKMRDTPEWKDYMEKGAFNTTFMSGDEYGKWLSSAEHRTAT